MVVCNIDVSEEPTMWGKFQKSMIIDKYDRKIGIIGVTSATTKVRITLFLEELLVQLLFYISEPRSNWKCAIPR